MQTRIIAVSCVIEEISKGVIQDNGYDFLDTEKGQPGPLMGIWLKTESVSESVKKIARGDY